MKIQNIAFAAIPLFLGLSCLGQSNSNQVLPAITSEKPNYTITITPPSGALSLKSPLLVEMYYTNTTSSDIYMEVFACKACTVLAERILVTKDGKEVETTPFQRISTGRGLPSDYELYPHFVGSGRTVRIHPGTFWRWNMDLRKLYDITEPGQYTITASRTEETKDGKFVVSSNVVILNIVP